MRKPLTLIEQNPIKKMRYPAVPSPSNSQDSIFRTVNALYQGYHALIGVPNSTDMTVISRGNLPEQTGSEGAISITESGLGNFDGLVYDDTVGGWVNSNVVSILAGACTVTSSLSPSNNFNIASVSKTSTGVYQFALSQSEHLDSYLLDKAVPSLVLSPGEITSPAVHPNFKTCALGAVSPSSGTFDVHVYQPTIVGTNAWLESVPTDLAGNDSIAVTVSVIRSTSIT